MLLHKLRFPEFLRTTTFRWTLTISAVFVASTLVLVAVLYNETLGSTKERIAATMLQDVTNTISDDPARASGHLRARLREDPRRVRLAALFDPEHRRITGNMREYPENFKPDESVWDIVTEREDAQGVEEQTASAIGGVLSNGNIYIVGRSFDDLEPLQESVVHTLTVGLLPATLLALICGVVLSMCTQTRIEEIHRMARRIMAGHLNERLPSRGTSDDFDKLVGIINAMLGQIEHLMSEVKGVGDDIAHDLRTPLTRVRAALERGRDSARSLDDLRGAVDKGLNGIDQALGVTTALLRIAALEQGQRNAGFSEVDLASIVGAIIELFEPAAEDKGIKLTAGGVEHAALHGDRDLLFEAISNLVDNAIKFTPTGGAVAVDLIRAGDNVLLRVSDSGPGIPRPEREAVFRRFYRSDKSRNTTGSGLGLSLVAAISRLHGFRVQVAESRQGCTIEMLCNPTSA